MRLEGLVRQILALSIALAILAFSASALEQLKIPQACSGGWTNCNYAAGNDNNKATASAGSSNVTGSWYSYFNFGAGTIINKVVLRAEFFASSPSGFAEISASGDGGRIFSKKHRIGGNMVETLYIIDITNDTQWTYDKLNNSNLRVNATCFSQNKNTTTCNLDLLAMVVTYTPFDFSTTITPQGNSIEKNSSTSAQIQLGLLSGISQPVGLYVTGCPAFSTCSLGLREGTPTFSTTLNIITGKQTLSGNYSLLITAYGKTTWIVRKAVYALEVKNLTGTSNCTRTSPNVTITPSTLNGTAGTTLSYTARVQNMDSTTCGNSTFLLYTESPWTVQSNPRVEISPGTYRSALLNLRSNINATPGEYNFTSVALNLNASAYKGTAQGIYKII